jgi:hypothetical protein
MGLGSLRGSALMHRSLDDESKSPAGKRTGRTGDSRKGIVIISGKAKKHTAGGGEMTTHSNTKVGGGTIIESWTIRRRPR